MSDLLYRNSLNRVSRLLLFALFFTSLITLLELAYRPDDADSKLLLFSFITTWVSGGLFVFSLVRGFLSNRLQAKGKRISKAPGKRLLAIVEFFYSPATVEETFKPIVADWQLEYFDALSQKRRWKARWISFRYTCSFIHAMGLSKALDFVRSFTRAGK